MLSAVISPDHVDELAGVLIGVASSWDLFLGQLGVENYKRKSIQLNNANKPDFPERCLLQGLDHWVLSDASPTYERVARALRGDMLHQDLLAVKVEQFAEAKLPRYFECDKMTRDYDVVCVCCAGKFLNCEVS